MPGFFRKTLTFLGFIDEESQEEEIDNQKRYSRDRRQKFNESEKRQELKIYKRNNEEEIRQPDKTQNQGWFRQPKKVLSLEEARMEKRTKVYVIAPNGFEDSQVIGDKFKNDIPVIVNLQNENPETSKRIIDFCSGLTYALNGSIEKVAEKVFLITPSNIEVTSEEKELLKGKGYYD